MFRCLLLAAALVSVPTRSLAGSTLRVHPIIPLENLTVAWAYYNKYIRQHVSHLIDSLPFSFATQNGDKQEVLTPKDIRKGISNALDMMPMANRTAFELELQRLRQQGSTVVMPTEVQHWMRLSNESHVHVRHNHTDRNLSISEAANFQQGELFYTPKIPVPAVTDCESYRSSQVFPCSPRRIHHEKPNVFRKIHTHQKKKYNRQISHFILDLII